MYPVAAARGRIFRPAITGGLILIDRTAGTNIGNLITQGGLAASFDGTTSQAAAACSGIASNANGYVGKTLAGPKVFGRAIFHGSNDVGFVSGTDPSITATVRGKTGAVPSNFATEGSVIGTVTFTDTTNESAGRQIESTDLVTAWDHIWLRVATGGADAKRVAELVLYEWA